MTQLRRDGIIASQGGIDVYSIKELAHLTGRTEQTIYRLARDNEEFKSVWEQEQTRSEKGKRLYGENVLSWLANHYNLSTTQEEKSDNARQTAQNAVRPSEDREKVENLIRENEALRGQIEALKRENELLRQQLSAAENRERDNKEIIGNALLCLQQATQTQKLLAMAKPSVFQRIRQHFSKQHMETEN